MRAVILAGGKGTRLKPYTTCLPKPLMPIGGEMPILEIVIKQLKQHGFNHITLSVNHLANIIMAFFQDGRKWGIKIDYSQEDKPLGTIAPIKLIPDLPDDFLIMNGDVFTDINYTDVCNYHLKNNNDITVSTYKRDIKIEFGEVNIDTENKITGFKEKPTYYYQVGMGVNILNKRILDVIPENQHYGFDNLILDGMKRKLKIMGYRFSGLWYDIGRPYDYDKVNEEWDDFKNKLFLIEETNK